MRILFVCTANICRSASAERLLRAAIAADPDLAGVEVSSAGTHALVGGSGCSMAPALAGHAGEHRATQLTAELVARADLILAAARDHRSAVVVLDPAARTRTFTIRQAGRISEWLIEAGMVAAARERAASGGSGSGDRWADRFGPGDPRAMVDALPDGREERWTWLVAEMDAARAMATVSVPVGDVPEEGGRSEGGAPGFRRWLRAPNVRLGSRGAGAPADELVDPDDVPDPHVLGAGLHGLAYEQISGATASLARLLHDVVQ